MSEAPIKVEVIGAQRVIANISAARDQFRKTMLDCMRRIVIDLHKEVVQNKLSGQVLNVRTGNLRRSINWRTHIENGGETVVGQVGTNASYAAAHEYGFQGTVNVPEHIRTLGVRGRQRWSAAGGGFTTVRAHTRRANIPERSFLRSALTENKERYVQQMEEAINKVVKRING